jgi:hypothetical protein
MGGMTKVEPRFWFTGSKFSFIIMPSFFFLQSLALSLENSEKELFVFMCYLILSVTRK